MGYFASVLEPGGGVEVSESVEGLEERWGNGRLWVFALVNLYNYCMVCISACGMHCREFGIDLNVL